MVRSILGLAAVFLCCVAALAQPTREPAREAPRADALRAIIPGHYMFTSGNLNSGVIATSDGVVVLDAVESEPVSRAEREAIAKTIGQPVRFLVSSTFHDNYSKGNVAFADVWKIGHETYRTDLLAQMQRRNVS